MCKAIHQGVVGADNLEQEDRLSAVDDLPHHALPAGGTRHHALGSPVVDEAGRGGVNKELVVPIDNRAVDGQGIGIQVVVFHSRIQRHGEARGVAAGHQRPGFGRRCIVRLPQVEIGHFKLGHNHRRTGQRVQDRVRISGQVVEHNGDGVAAGGVEGGPEGGGGVVGRTHRETGGRAKVANHIGPILRQRQGQPDVGFNRSFKVLEAGNVRQGDSRHAEAGQHIREGSARDRVVQRDMEFLLQSDHVLALIIEGGEGGQDIGIWSKADLLVVHVDADIVRACRSRGRVGRTGDAAQEGRGGRVKAAIGGGEDGGGGVGHKAVDRGVGSGRVEDQVRIEQACAANRETERSKVGRKYQPGISINHARARDGVAVTGNVVGACVAAPPVVLSSRSGQCGIKTSGVAEQAVVVHDQTSVGCIIDHNARSIVHNGVEGHKRAG